MISFVGSSSTTKVDACPPTTGFGSSRTVFQVVQTFPLTFQSPSARVSLKINQRMRWNAGYQYYGYRQEFNLNPNLNYQANTGYTSLSFAF